MHKILVVDDDPDIVFALSLLLRKEGYEVRTASSRAEGWKPSPPTSCSST
jgi:DNA-binding response OmpR family regulator